MKKNNGQLQIGDYVSFDSENHTLYKVYDIDEKSNHTYILYIDETGDKVWERLEYVTSIFKIDKEIITKSPDVYDAWEKRYLKTRLKNAEEK